MSDGRPDENFIGIRALISICLVNRITTIWVKPMCFNHKKAISVSILLVGYSALIAGLFALGVQPLVGVLMVLGGMALSICSAAELVQDRPEPDSPSRSK